MKIFSFLVFTPAAVLVLGGCMQQAEEMPQSDFLLKLYKSDSASGKSVSYTDHSLNVNGSAKAVLKYQVKGSRIELQMGIEPGTNVQARMNALLVFKNTPNPLLAAGLYRFPEDSSRLAIVLKERTAAADLTYSVVLDGQVDVQYDAFSKTFSGTFRYIRFSPIPGEAYDRLNFTGWFNDALLEQ